MDIKFPQTARAIAFLVFPLLINVLTPNVSNAWTVKGKWSTANFNCRGTNVEIGVDMKSRIGGGDAAPVRPAYMVIGQKKLDSVWIVGASMNSVSTNNRNFELVLGNKGVFLDTPNRKNISCAEM